MHGQNSDAYEAARQAFREKNFTLANKLFRKAELQGSGGNDAAVYLALTLLKLNQIVDADAALGRYLRIHPENAAASFLRGYVLFRENRASPSLEAYTHAATLATPKADDLKIVALDYVLLQDYDSAIRWLQRSVELDAKDPEAWYFLGRSLFSRSQFAEAERAFVQALQLDPTDTRARNNLGLTYEAENRFDDALREYQETISRDRIARTAHATSIPAVKNEAENSLAIADSGTPASLKFTGKPQQAGDTEAQPYLNLGSLLTLQNHTADAVPILREATLLSARCVACHLQLGRALARTGDSAAARSELELAVKLDPADPASHYELGLFYQRAGDKAAAKVELERSKDLYGSHAAGPREY